MKIVSLNTYCGMVFRPLMGFIERLAVDTDVFCFQEIISSLAPDLIHVDGKPRRNLFQEIQQRLPDFNVYFSSILEKPRVDPANPAAFEGLATFVRKDLHVLKSGKISLANGRVGLYVQIATEDIPLTIGSVHAVAEPHHKLDTPERLKQSEAIITFLQDQPGKVMMVGDFNLLPETDSVKMFERAGYRDLIKDFKIKTTRGTHMRKLYPEFEHGPFGFQEFADYMFISPDITVHTFTVPDEPISDHLPLILDCDA